MPNASLQDIAAKMRNLDIATFTTVTESGGLAGRPMSNNGDVEYDGNSYYFTYDKSRIVSDIQRDASVSVAFEGDDHLYVTVSGKAELIKDKAEFEKHWVPDLETWFEEGTDTPGLVLIKVAASHIKVWAGEEQHEWTA